MKDQKQKVLRAVKTIFMATLITVAGSNQVSAQEEAVPWATDVHLSPEVHTFLKALNTGGPGIETLSPEAARQVLAGAQAGVKVDLSGIEVSEKTIKSDGLTVKLNIVRPAGVKGILPVVIFIHGGGWVLGDFPTHERLVRDIVVGSGCVAVFPNYTPAPDAKYPVAINEIYAATKWVAEHGSEINVDGKKLAVMGNSVGGNMTAAICLMAKERKGPEIKTAIMMWPVTDGSLDYKSFELFGQDRFLTKPLMAWMFDEYTKDPAQRNEILYSPLKATLDQLKGLPPTLIQVAENDILRDEGEAYGRKLLDAGVIATTVRYNGVIHDWGMLNGLATIPQTKQLVLQASAQLKQYLK